MQCFTQHDLTQKFLDYLKTDPSMKIFVDALQVMQISMDSLDTILTALNSLCGKNCFQKVLTRKHIPS